MSTSVVLATYNGARFLPMQLASLASQERPPHELIVSDDGSTDDTLAIVERFAARSHFPVIIRRNAYNLGYGENFLRAAGLATGKFISFCDQDDVWRADKIAASEEVLLTSEADLFVHRATLIDDTGRVIGRYDQNIRRTGVYGPRTLPPWQVYYGCTMVFSRERLFEMADAKLRGPHTFEYDRPLSHDLWVTFLASSLRSIAVDTRPLVAYRQHSDNITPSVLSSGFRAWFRRLGLPADPVLARHTTALYRAELLRRLAADGSHDTGARRAAAQSADWWMKVSRHEHGRIELYTSPRAVDRARTFIGLIANEVYSSPSRAGLGKRMLLKDAVAGVGRGAR